MSKVFDAYAAYYDLLYKDKNYEAEAEYIRSLLAEQGVTGGAILELGCGTGKHAELFTQMGFSVHGIDMSPAMVEEANKRKPADLADQLHFETGDVRDYQVNQQFDAVVSLFHVASYQTTDEDLEAMFATASRHLKPGGVFVFDYWHGPGVVSDKPTLRVKRMENDSHHVIRIAEPEMQVRTNTVNVKYTIFIRNNNIETYTKVEESHLMRYMFIEKLEQLARSNDYRSVHNLKWLTHKQACGSDWLACLVCRK